MSAFHPKADGVDGSRSRHPGAKVVVVINHEQEEPSAMNISTVGLDLAKNVFQVHGIDGTGKVITRSAYTIRASGSKTPRQQAGHKTVPDLAAMSSKSPCNAGAIHTRRKSGVVRTSVHSQNRTFGIGAGTDGAFVSRLSAGHDHTGCR